MSLQEKVGNSVLYKKYGDLLSAFFQNDKDDSAEAGDFKYEASQILDSPITTATSRAKSPTNFNLAAAPAQGNNNDGDSWIMT